MSHPSAVSFKMDAFSDGQMGSKLWLCEILEKFFPERDSFPNVWVYGSWYGLLPFLMLTRDRYNFQSFTLIDIDAEAIEISKKVLNHWMFANHVRFDFRVEDCAAPTMGRAKPDLVINTSCEHIASMDWWKTIPEGCNYLLQSTNMKHDEHVNLVHSAEELRDRVRPSRAPLFLGTKQFVYPELEFDRYMILGMR